MTNGQGVHRAEGSLGGYVHLDIGHFNQYIVSIWCGFFVCVDLIEVGGEHVVSFWGPRLLFMIFISVIGPGCGRWVSDGA